MNKLSVRVRSLGKALEIIEFLARAKKEMGLSEITNALDLPKSTAHDLLSTLKEYGYIEQSLFTGKYKLGLRLFEIGNIVANGWDVRMVAAPYIQRLVDEIKATVHLVILDKGEVLYIDKRESQNSLEIVSRIGMRLPAHCTGVGKVLLAYLPSWELEQIIMTKGLPRYTPQTITDAQNLRKELESIKACSYAIDRGEFMENLYCIAAPIRDNSNEVIAAISVSGPSRRINTKEYPPLILETALDISRGLGYRPIRGENGLGHQTDII